MQRRRTVALTLCAVARRAGALLLVAALTAGSFGGEATLPLRDLRDAVRGKLPPPDTDPFLGVVLDEGSPVVAAVIPGSTADRVGITAGDEIDSLGTMRIRDSRSLRAALDAQRPDAPVKISLRRAGREVAVSSPLGRRRRPDSIFRGARFQLAVVPLAFADDAARPPEPARVDRLLFARRGVDDPSPSLADYYAAQSFGRLDVVGRVLAPVTLPAARAVYAARPMGGAPDSAYAAAAKELQLREGEAMAGFDGIAFLYSGAAETRPGFALWPHRASVSIGGRRLPYYVHAFGGDADAIGVHCHEFGHLLGLPDSYGAAHLTGSGDFCVMAIGHRGGAASGARRPFSLCAWCRMRLGWLEPVEIDPRAPQRVRLAPVATGEAMLLPLTSTTLEYLLLEVRTRTGFDRELPSAGLLAWRVGGAPTPGQGSFGNYVNLLPAHGVDCIDAALVKTSEIAFPTARSRHLTPRTRPSTGTDAPGALATYVTDIESLPDGSVALTLGVPLDVAPAPATADSVNPDADGYLVRKDPITGCEVRLFVGAPAGTPPAATGASR